MPTPIHKRALQRAVEIAGGSDQLARRLALAPTHIAMWLSHEYQVPGDVFLQVVDFLVEHSLNEVTAAKRVIGDSRKDDPVS